MTEPTRNHSQSHEELRTFLDQYGIQPGMSPAARDKRLTKIMKSKRTKRLARVNEQYVQGRVSLQLIIDCLQSPEEANIFCSISHDSAATIGGNLYELMAPHLYPGCTIADLGCYTGGFAAWLAAKHPECRVLGFDCHEKVIGFATQLSTASNISFRKWNYERDNPPDIEPIDLLT